jgi:hypothetical protein
VNEDWQSLKVGDQIRIIRMPSAESMADYVLPANTRRFYKRLIALKKRLAVYEIDRDGRPWIQCALRRNDGGLDYHFLAVDDDSWVRVKIRRRPG